MKSVRTSLLALVALCILLATSGFAIVLWQSHLTAREQTLGQAQRTAQALSQAVDSQLEKAGGVAAALAVSDAVRLHDWTAVDREARAALANRDTWIVVQDRSGHQLVNTGLPIGAPLRQGNPPAEMWRALDAGNVHICNLVQGVVEPKIVCLDAGVGGSPRPEFAITVAFRPQAFQAITARQDVRRGHLVTLVDRNGVVIWRNIRPEAFIGRRATDRMLAALRAPPPSGTLESTSLDGVRMFTAYQRSPLSGWSVIVGLPANEIDTGAHSAALAGLALALGILLLGCGFAILLTRRITKGLDGLAHVLDTRNPGTEIRPTGLAEFDAAAGALRQAMVARFQSEQHQQMLIGELNHRVKNTLAVVQSLAHQTFRSASSENPSVGVFEARLQALAAAHNMLTRERWVGAPLRDVVQNALTPFCGQGRCTIAGPNVDLPPEIAVNVALALHELATNAVKYGALSAPNGKVSVHWTATGSTFELVWEEKDGPPVAPPDHEGFGTRFIRRSLATQLRGEVEIDYLPAGLRCRVVGSLAQRAA